MILKIKEALAEASFGLCAVKVSVKFYERGTFSVITMFQPLTG
jgi:hypothetical protein